MNLETIFKAATTDEWPGQEDRIMNAIEAAYSLGFHEGRTLERSMARTFASGAIRRAAEIMRWHENNAKRLAPLRPDGLNEYEAKAIRNAIRAAIGSDKT